MRPRLLDLFCGAGGAAMGYHRAGFDVVGVDIEPQPHYPFEFHRGDAMTWPLDGYDAIHASPPCQDHSVLRHRTGRCHETGWMLAAVTDRLAGRGEPWVVENVGAADMPRICAVVMLCGSSFGLRVRRHRLFASSVALMSLPCAHRRQGQPLGVYGRGGAWTRRAPGGGGTKVSGVRAAEVLGIDWTVHQPSLAQAIPPAYTEHIGRQLMAYVA